MRAASAALRLTFLLVLGMSSIPFTAAQTFTVLYNFAGASDGAYPYAGLVGDTAGNFYGTTYNGGSGSSGTVFKIDSSGNETVLYSFSGARDGQYPYASLILDPSGNLYSTTAWGGRSGRGTVFKVKPSGHETVLYSFTGSGGYDPVADLVMDADGNLYGTAKSGGPFVYGTVFKVDTRGHEKVLHNFSAGSDGARPLGGLVRDTEGNLYGTTTVGGARYNDGTVFKIDSSGTLTLLHRFTGYPKDGANPAVGLIVDANGNLYGNTCWGGAHGWGTVFRVNKTGKETVLYSFRGRDDGGCPNGRLLLDAAGNLYGNTCYGGARCHRDYGCGVIFELEKSGKQTVLHSFTGEDGAYPYGDLVQDAAGNLYGTAAEGGTNGYGTVWKLTPE